MSKKIFEFYFKYYCVSCFVLKMAGSSHWPYKYLRSYERVPFPGHLPVKQSCITEKEEQSAANIKYMVTPYKKLQFEGESENETKLFQTLADIKRENPTIFEKFMVKHCSRDLLCKWFSMTPERSKLSPMKEEEPIQQIDEESSKLSYEHKLDSLVSKIAM